MFWMCDVMDVRCVCTDSDDKSIVARQIDGQWKLRRIQKMDEPRVTKVFSVFNFYTLRGDLSDANLTVTRNRDVVTIMSLLVEERKETKFPVRVEMMEILGVLLLKRLDGVALEELGVCVCVCVLCVSVSRMNAGRVPQQQFQSTAENWIAIVQLERELNEHCGTIEEERVHIARCKAKYLTAIAERDHDFVVMDVAATPFVRAWFAIADVPRHNLLSVGDPNHFDSLSDLVKQLEEMTFQEMISKLWKALFDAGMKAQFVYF